MADESGSTTATVAPPLSPPLLEVGYNYTWPFNRYGTTIGPRDLANDPPTGASDKVPVFRDTALVPPAGSLDRNLKILRDELKIRKVRIFLMGNAFNYGKAPISPLPSGRSFFTAPPFAHPLFFDHFREMLQVFQANEMQVIPSLIDFGAFYPLSGGGGGGGRTSVLTSQRTRFLETVLKPMLGVSREKGLENTVFAWEVVNEPVWNTIAAPLFLKRPHTRSDGPDVGIDVMATFIDDCLKVIQGDGFQSTVGHRFLSDLTDTMPTGTMPQFHYYAGTSLARRTFGVGDPDPIPKLSELAGDSRTRNAFIGEFSAAPGGDKNQFGDEEPGAVWPECRDDSGNQLDQDRARASFERLAVLARKGYKLAFVWPDRSDKERGVVNSDELKLSDDAKKAIKLFTRGRFPNGVP